MTTDRTLLELAALAAGLEIKAWDIFKPDEGPVPILRGDYVWRPLTDDGDALRLAVKLQIQVTPGTYNKDEFTAFKAAGGEAHEFRSFLQDDYAATRRAILRAAAEIGRNMK